MGWNCHQNGLDINEFKIKTLIFDFEKWQKNINFADSIMNPSNRNTLSRIKSLILKSLGITLLAFSLSFLLRAPFSASTSSLFAGAERNDFKLSDLYAQIADDRPVRRLEDRIVVIDIGNGGRQEISEVLEVLSLCGPKVVGLDINFESPGDDDTRLLAALQSIPDLVLPLGLRSQEGKFEIEDKPFFYGQMSTPVYAAVNMPTLSPKSTIREFVVKFPLSADTIYSFPVALAQIFDPSVVEDLKARGNKLEPISFHSKEFQIITADEVIDYAENFADKIVLIGSLSDAYDIHPTPTKASMPGLMVHVNALSTLLDREWYTPIPGYIDYILALVICFLIILAAIGIKMSIKGLIIRLFQIILAYCAVRIGYSLFVDHRIITSFSTTLLMIAFGLFAVDIWNGIEGLYHLIVKRINRRKNKTITKKCGN